MITARALKKVYQSNGRPVSALDGLDVHIEKGEFAAVMGPSGCGKSTLLNLIAGLDRPTSGTLMVDGRAPAEMSERELTSYRREVVGVIFQFYNLLPTLSIRENIMLPSLLAGTSEKNAEEKARILADRVGISHRFTHRTHELSGGEMQRAAIARALVNGPAVVLADEPTGNLDSHSAQGILEVLRDLSSDHATTIVMVTHDPHSAEAAGRVIHMVDGRVVEGHEALAAG